MRTTLRTFRMLVVLLAVAVVAGAATLPSNVKDELGKAQYVYISTERKNGTFGKPAEIWFLVHEGAVYVASPATTWRAKRIKAGRTKAKVAVGKPTGPSFDAKGDIVKDEKLNAILFETFAKKYADGWSRHEKGFREGLRDGTRVLIRYTPA